MNQQEYAIKKCDNTLKSITNFIKTVNDYSKNPNIETIEKSNKQFEISNHKRILLIQKYINQSNKNISEKSLIQTLTEVNNRLCYNFNTLSNYEECLILFDIFKTIKQLGKDNFNQDIQCNNPKIFKKIFKDAPKEIKKIKTLTENDILKNILKLKQL